MTTPFYVTAVLSFREWPMVGVLPLGKMEGKSVAINVNSEGRFIIQIPGEERVDKIVTQPVVIPVNQNILFSLAQDENGIFFVRINEQELELSADENGKVHYVALHPNKSIETNPFENYPDIVVSSIQTSDEQRFLNKAGSLFHKLHSDNFNAYLTVGSDIEELLLRAPCLIDSVAQSYGLTVFYEPHDIRIGNYHKRTYHFIGLYNFDVIAEGRPPIIREDFLQCPVIGIDEEYISVEDCIIVLTQLNNNLSFESMLTHNSCQLILKNYLVNNNVGFNTDSTVSREIVMNIAAVLMVGVKPLIKSINEKYNIRIL